MKFLLKCLCNYPTDISADTSSLERLETVHQDDIVVVVVINSLNNFGLTRQRRSQACSLSSLSLPAQVPG